MLKTSSLPFLGITALALASLRPASAQDSIISVPNPSFELPATEFVDTRIDAWQKFPKPDWYQESPGQMWDQLIGLFANTDPGSTDHIDNVDGSQAIFLFALPQVGLFQDYNSIGGLDTEPSHEFNATFLPGPSYTLTVGIVGGGGNMAEGASLQLSLYYRDAEGNPIPVNTTTITHSAELFPNTTHLVDFTVSVPPVQPTDPWAGQHLGIMFVSTVAPELVGGYWDLDHVRLTTTGASPAAPTLEFTRTGADLQLSWPSTAGNLYQLQVSHDLRSWADYAQPQPGDGTGLSALLPLAEFDQAFFRLQEWIAVE